MRRIWIPIAILVAAIGCGTPGGSAPDLPDVENAAAKTLAQGTAKTYSKQVMTFTGDVQGTVTMESEGVIDFETLRQHATMTSEGEGSQGEAIAGQVGEMELISDGLIVYFKSEFFRSMIPNSNEWLKLDLQAAGEKAGMDLGSVTGFGSGDAAQQLDYLKGVEDVREVGKETVRGVETTHYSGTATLDALRDELDDAGDQTLDRLEELTGIDEFDIDVWLDSEGVARRMSYAYDTIPLGTTTMDGTWDFTLEYFDFGTEVDIEIPPADEVTDLLEAAEEMGAGP